MKTFKMSFLLSVFIIFISAGFSYAQMGMMWQGSGGWGKGSSYCGMFDNSSIETFTGEVVSVDKFTPLRGMSNGVRLMVKTDKETVYVHLGPMWFIEKQDLKIEPKDKITVKGSKIVFDGKKTIMATEIKKGSEVLKLWDDRGYPLWSGHGWR